MESSAIEAEVQQMDIDNEVENTSSSATPNTQRVRANSVVDSIGFKKYLAVCARRRTKSLSTTNYYTPSESEYKDNLCIPGTSRDKDLTNNKQENEQSNKMKESDTIDAQMSELRKKEINFCVKKETINSSKPTAFMSVSKNADCYNMNHKNRGKCIIFNHEKFDISYDRRNGSEKDAQRLQTTFEKLGFDVELHTDFTYHEILDKLDKVKQLDHTDNDCLCIITLTHGIQDDMICAKDVVYKSDSLWKPFAADKCLTLAGKPKLFIIQACRGEKFDNGILLSPRSLRETETDSHSNEAYSIPTHADFLIAHSSIQGFLTWRNPYEGTWYIQCLCDVLDEYGATMDLMNIMTLTARKIATEFTSSNDKDPYLHNKRQVPSVTSMLIRSVYFPSKLKT